MQTRFRALDGFRGICALCVALFHLGPLGPLLGLSFFRNSYLLVDFFFVLSGFVITHSQGRRLAQPGQAWQFLGRRLGRLWPLHAFAIVLLVADQLVLLTLGRPGEPLHDTAFTGLFQWQSLPASLLLIQALGLYDCTPWNAPSWSISAELGVYLAFIGLIRIKPRLRNASLLLAALLGALVVASQSPQGLNTTYDYGFFRCLYGFCIGCLVFELWQRQAAWTRFIGRLENLAVGLSVLFICRIGQSGWALAAPLVFGCVILIFAHERGLISGWLRGGLMAKLGAWSYSIYLMHWPLLLIIHQLDSSLAHPVRDWLSLQDAAGPASWLAGALRDGLLTAAYLSMVITCASLTYRWIERPGCALCNRWLRSRTSASPPDPVANDPHLASGHFIVPALEEHD